MISLFLFSLAHAFQPDGAPFIGIEPNRHRHVHAARQHELRNRTIWKDFQEKTGWHLLFDEKTGEIFRGKGKGIDLSPEHLEEDIFQFLLRHRWYDPKKISIETSFARYNQDLDAWYVHFEQTIPVQLHDDRAGVWIDRVEVWRGGVDAFVHSNRLSMIESRLYPDVGFQPAQLSSSQALSIALAQGKAPDATHSDISVHGVVLPLEKNNVLELKLCWEVRSKTEHPKGHWVVFVDAHTGDVHNIHNEVRFLEGSVHAVHDARTVDGNTQTSALSQVKIGEGAFSDEAGYFSVAEESLSITLNGKHTRISNAIGEDLSFDLVEGEQIIELEGDEAFAQIDQFVFQNEIYAWAKEYAPHVVNAWPRSVVNVNQDDVCNAYFDGTLNFFRAGEGCNNTGRIRDVSHHEWGHGFHYYNLLSGNFDGAMSEGIADAIAFFQSEDAVMAPYFGVDGFAIREAATNRVYPADIVNEVHTDGLIFAGAVWDLWPELEEHYGDGTQAKDALMHLFVQALRSGPDIPSSYDAFLFADDDNGDLSDGTPHECALVEAFGQHGLGPKGEGGFFQLSHLPLDNQSTEASEYLLDVDIQEIAVECADALPEQALIHYSLDGGESWDQSVLSYSATEGITGALPAQEQGSIVSYYIELVDEEGRGTQVPEQGIIHPFTFYVGPIEQIYCNDFEQDDGGFKHELVSGREQEGADDWMWGTPVGLGGDPDYAASGDKVWGNDLGGEHNGESYNGEYQNEKWNRLTTPDFDVSGYDEVLLVYKRWLNVEDGYYDHARILANGETVWSNHETRYEVGDEHHQDKQWQLHVVRANALDVDLMNFAWEIESDQGLSMGGWTIDDVCVYGVPAFVEDEPENTGGGCGCSTQDESSSFWLLLGLLGVFYRRRHTSRR